jgi:hypothetical protein
MDKDTDKDMGKEMDKDKDIDAAWNWNWNWNTYVRNTYGAIVPISLYGLSVTHHGQVPTALKICSIAS